MSYQQFAYFYDQLMEEAPYELWISYLKQKINQYGITGRRILDVACGTGSISIPLAKEGFEVTGVDLSTEMLAVAQMKANEEGLTIPFYHQNMVEMAGFDPFDCIVVFCDSLNYLYTEEQVKKTFENIYSLLKSNGLLLFDVHSLHKINEVFVGNTFGSNDDELSFIWHCFAGEAENSVEHELTFFSKVNDYYQRFDECHIQRTFSQAEYTKWLKEAKFIVHEVTDFDQKPVNDETERIFFVCQKK